MIIKPRLPNVALARAQAYPSVGDQLDAVVKLAAFLKEGGMKLPAEVDSWVEDCLSVKKRFPKQDSKST